MKYLKYFKTEASYTQFKGTEDYVLPNISYVEDIKGVKYERKKAYMLRAKYNATPDNLVAFRGASNVNSMSVNGTPIEIEPIKIETTAFDVLGENISMDMETGEGTFPESYAIKPPVSSWSFKAKDPNYVINENTYICMLGMMDGMTMVEPMPLEAVMGYYFTVNDGVTLEVNDIFLDSINMEIESGAQMGFTLVDIDMNNETFTFIDTEHQANLITGGISTYSFDNEGIYDVIIELADPDIKMSFIETPLTSIEIDNDITSIGYESFHGCSSLTSVTIGNSVTSIRERIFEGCNSLTNINIPNSVTAIGDGAFAECSSLTNITIPDSVTIIGYEAFLDCTSLTNVTIGNNVTSIGGRAFFDCTNLTNINIPNSVTEIGGGAFNGCTSLTSITIPNSVTSIVGGTFFYCTSLTSITIPNSVTSIEENAFNGCSSLTSINIPDGVTSIEFRVFAGCSSLTSITIPNSVTSIENSAFDDCSSLTSINIGNSVTSIGDYAFAGCSSLTSVTIPDSVTRIGSYVFSNCSNLTSVTIGNSVTSIGDYVFGWCNNLASIICYAPTAPSIMATTFDSVSNDGTLYVPTGSDYSSWMSTNPYYLGFYNRNWTIQYI